MGRAARSDRLDGVLELLGRCLVALASPSRLGLSPGEALSDVLRHVEVGENVRSVRDVHGVWRAPKRRRGRGTPINKSTTQRTYELVKFSSKL